MSVPKSRRGESPAEYINLAREIYVFTYNRVRILPKSYTFYFSLPLYNAARGRTPQGVRGLKSAHEDIRLQREKSHPARGAWIEIIPSAFVYGFIGSSHPARGAWIEISRTCLRASLLK